MRNKTLFTLIGMIIVFTILASLVMVIYYENTRITGLAVDTNPETIFPETELNQLYPVYLKWENTPVTYSFENEQDCGSIESQRIRNAFEIIQENTEGKIKFKEGSNTDITIVCHRSNQIQTLSDDGSQYITATATPYTDNSKITSGEIHFYNTGDKKISSNCATFPDVEIHEILHLFGMEHVNERYSIMNVHQLYCPTKINKEIIDKLLVIYS